MEKQHIEVNSELNVAEPLETKFACMSYNSIVAWPYADAF